MLNFGHLISRPRKPESVRRLKKRKKELTTLWQFLIGRRILAFKTNNKKDN